MQQSADRALPHLDEHGVLLVDVACRRCVYNLRGLPEDGCCPECGTSIGLSTRGYLLRFADPDWLDKVALGLKLILWLILVNIGVRVQYPLLMMDGHTGVADAFWLGASIANFVGVWLLTEPDPSGLDEESKLAARRIVRISLFIGLAGTLLELLVHHANMPAPEADLLSVVAAVATLITFVSEFAKFAYFGRLAGRIPDDHAARRAQFLTWTYPSISTLNYLSGLVMERFGIVTAGPSGPTKYFIFINVPLGIAKIVFAIMMLFLLLRLRRAIAVQALLARGNWAAADDVRARIVDSDRHRR